MMKLIILLAVAIAQQAYCDEPERIVGGDMATLGQFKYQVSLQSYGEHICGGSIISSTHILTAAHCVNDDFYTNGMVVVSGLTNLATNGEKHEIKCIRIHPSYTGEKESGWKDDIAVITLKKPIKMNDVQGPIPLASKDHVNGGKRGIVSGWGKTQISGSTSILLRWLEVNVLSQERCLHGHKNPRTNENQICTLEKVGKGACQGDSGGPLVVDNELVGIVSWVLPCALGISDVYTNVYKYLDFVKESQSMC
ncbi:PREDICTED: chymotrypsin-1-like [Wasmannia auropunctata]|uniref:chymotrypsin-1-like n=1 Tax=Wasmannia auropunctata TaxID=64793 RepID=UPI0005F06286|nr:PREDICTED: chymotrypsin-1-like [Wasmannia auropunctata]